MRCVAVLRVSVIAGLALLASIAAEPADRVVADEAPLQPDCIEHAESVQLSSAAEAEARMVRTWIRCRQATRKFVALEGDDIGFEFTADGRFYRIYPDGSGGLIRAEGLYQEGVWQISDPYPEEFEERAVLQLQPLGTGSFSDVIIFYDDPDAIGVPYAKFHCFRWTGDDPTPGIPAGITEGPCGNPVDPVVPESAAGVEALLLGTWTVCQADAGYLLGPGVVGIEFAADGQFWSLVRAADGSVVRDADLPAATWEVDQFDADTWSWGNAPLVTITSDGAEQYINPIFLSEPPALTFGWHGGNLLTRTPLASEVPLPATGADRVLLIALLAGAFGMAGSATWALSRRERSATTSRPR